MSDANELPGAIDSVARALSDVEHAVNLIHEKLSLLAAGQLTFRDQAALSILGAIIVGLGELGPAALSNEVKLTGAALIAWDAAEALDRARAIHRTPADPNPHAPRGSLPMGPPGK